VGAWLRGMAIGLVSSSCEAFSDVSGLEKHEFYQHQTNVCKPCTCVN
jgi:hypothetical protein